jgi:hypothetical protein
MSDDQILAEAAARSTHAAVSLSETMLLPTQSASSKLTRTDADGPMACPPGGQPPVKGRAALIQMFGGMFAGPVDPPRAGGNRGVRNLAYESGARISKSRAASGWPLHGPLAEVRGRLAHAD